MRRVLEGSLLLFFVVIAGCMAVMVQGYIADTREQDMSVETLLSDFSSVSGTSAGTWEAGSESDPGAGSGSSSSAGSTSFSDRENGPGRESVTDSGTGSKSADSMVYITLGVEPPKTMESIDRTISFFTQRISFLQQAMRSSGYCFSEEILDENTGTTAFILAKNENCAQNLNAYFYYLFDAKPSTSVISPVVLNISALFEQENRETAVEDGSFAQKGLLDALKLSLTAVLGSYYNEEIFTFIYSEYVRTFAERLNGDPLQTPVCKLASDHVEVIFHNSFLTYVEFFLNP